MKGSDVTSEQLVEAEAFLRVPAGDQADRDPILLARKDLLRLLAWYGEIRAEGARRGISRGIPVTIPTRKASATQEREGR